MTKKRKYSKSSPPSRSQKKMTKKKPKKQIYDSDSDSSSLSEGEIADDKPVKKQPSKNRSSIKYDMSDDSIESSDNESDSPSNIVESTQSKYILFV